MQVVLSQALRETSGDLRQENADFRDFMRESCLQNIGRCERWRDKH